jgi:hypothetical protein
MVGAKDYIRVVDIAGNRHLLPVGQLFQPLGRCYSECRRAGWPDDQEFARRNFARVHATAFIFCLTLGNSVGYP